MDEGQNNTNISKEERHRAPEMPFHKRLALFLGGVGGLTAGIYLWTGSGDFLQLVLITSLIVLAILMYFFGDIW